MLMLTIAYTMPSTLNRRAYAMWVGRDMLLGDRACSAVVCLLGLSLYWSLVTWTGLATVRAWIGLARETPVQGYA